MDIIEAIETRRSISKVQDRVPRKDLIEKMLYAAQWAPNHYHTEPWSFEVLTGTGREKLGDAYGRINIESLGEMATEEERQNAYEKGMTKAKRAPVVIVIKVQPKEHERVEYVEEVAATACAVQNMWLTAHSLGLGVIWRTGKPAYHSIMNKAFGLTGRAFVFGFLYVGYPLTDFQPNPPKKRPIDEVVKWVDQF